MAQVRAALVRMQLPGGVRIEYGGLYMQQQSTRQLLAVFAGAVMLVFVLLPFVYERFAVALAILLTALLALPGVFVGLWASGTERNISAMMGMTMVIGMITEIAIFYFSELDLAAPPQPAALMRTGVGRMRAILVSASIAVLTLAPLASGLGASAAMQKPLAIAIVAGLIMAVPLVLNVMPPLYALLVGTADRVASAASRSRSRSLKSALTLGGLGCESRQRCLPAPFISDQQGATS